jgi:NADH dehydrogenase
MIKTVCRTALRDDFRRIKPANARIILLEGGPRILPELSEHLSARATRDLQDLGVEVRTGARVTSVDAEGIWIGNERLACRTVLWAAGTRGSPIGRSLNVPLDKIGRVIVEPDLSVPGHPEIFVVGDQCYFPHVGTGRAIPAVAPAANQMGDAAAANILRTIWKQARKPFVYFDKGDLAVIGRYRAVAAFRGMEFTGLAAWFVWLFIHILYLASFRNRLSVMLQWGWAYATWQRGMRIILDRNAHDNIGKRKPEKALPAATQ